MRPSGVNQDQGNSPALHLPADEDLAALEIFPKLLARVALLRGEALLAALRRDQRERWLREQPIPAETYLAECLRLDGDADLALVLVYSEYLLRQERGETPDLQEYLHRFPEHAARLRAQHSLHRALVPSSKGARGNPPPPSAVSTLPSTLSRPGAQEGERDWPVIPGYEILGLVGRGGMGVIYQARDCTLGRVVALKMILAGDHADEEQLARFHAEAQAIARLQHPHIVQIHEVGEHAGRPYLALEFVDGGSLAQALATGAWPVFGKDTPRRAAQLLITVASAIHYAHVRGIVHRDLKPANILLVSGRGVSGEWSNPPLTPHHSPPTAKITDFGLAKHLDADSGQTRSGAILGTPSYMAPEQAEGKARAIGPATDTYALGAVLYELLTGRPPFQAETPLETLRQVQSQEAVAVSTLQPRAPRDLETICHKCLNKEPAKRYPTARALAEDLQRFLNGQPILARRSSLGERGWRWCRRNPAVAILLLVASLLAAGITTVSTVSAFRLSRETQKSQLAERDATVRLYHASYVEAQALRFTGRLGQRFESLKALAQGAESARKLELGAKDFLDLRNEAIAAMALPDLSLGDEWEGQPEGTNGLAFDANYERYVRSRTDTETTLSVRQVTGDQEIMALRGLPSPGKEHLIALQFSPQDRFLAGWYLTRTGSPDRPLQVWDLSRKETTARWSLPNAVGYVAFGPRDEVLAVGLPDGSIGLYEPASGKEIKRLAGGLPVYRLAFHPDERTLAVASTKLPGLQLRDVRTGMVLRELAHAAGVQGLAWDPDGKTLATGAIDHRIYLWDVETGEQKAILVGHQWELADLYFDSTGDLLLSRAFDRTTRLWDARAGKSLMSLPECRHAGFGHHDGIVGAVMRGTRLGLCRLHISQEYRPLHRIKGPFSSLQFSPDGRLLLAIGPAGIRVWDVVLGKVVSRLHGIDVATAFLEPLGKSLLTYDGNKLQRWPLHFQRADGPAPLQVGPPRTLFTFPTERDGGHMCWWGAAGAGLGVAGRQNIYLLQLKDPPELALSWSLPGNEYVASSPDGRWFAAGTFEGSGVVQVWDTQQRKVAKEWAVGDATVAFSPDGQWLAFATGNNDPAGAHCYQWRVGTWEPGPRIRLQRTSSPAFLDFAPDRKMLAVTHTMTEVLLVDPNTFAEIARLQAREPQLITGLAFSPDGNTLAVATGHAQVQLWDLRAIRERLAGMGLDW